MFNNTCAPIPVNVSFWGGLSILGSSAKRANVSALLFISVCATNIKKRTFPRNEETQVSGGNRSF